MAGLQVNTENKRGPFWDADCSSTLPGKTRLWIITICPRRKNIECDKEHAIFAHKTNLLARGVQHVPALLMDCDDAVPCNQIADAYVWTMNVGMMN